jgi:integrase
MRAERHSLRTPNLTNIGTWIAVYTPASNTCSIANAAVVGYYNSLAFRELAPETQKLRRRILERFRARLDDNGRECGDKSIATLPREAIVRMLANMAPFARQNWLKTLRGLMQFAVAEGFRASDPTQDLKAPTKKSAGFHTWTDAEIEQFESQRLALALLLYTAQRRGDVVRMGRQYVRNSAIAVRQQKTGAALDIPIHPELQRVLDATAIGNLTFLVSERGEPFSAPRFGNWFRERCREAGLPKGCSAHGLRKAAARRLAEAGCTAHEIAAMTGHPSLREIEW